MNTFKRLCVYAGSSPGLLKKYSEIARDLGRACADNDIELVYGGGKVGLMGEIANSVLQNGGRVIGVIPGFLEVKEVAHTGLTELQIVDSMHERKKRMFDLSDGFIALPGGLGTLEELFEVLTWVQLGLHTKPCALLNAAAYFDPLIAFLDQSVSQEFVKPQHRQMILIDDSVSGILEKMQTYQAPETEKWLKRRDDI